MGTVSPLRPPVGIDGRAADHGEDVVARGQGIGEALQRDHRAALGPDEPVGGGIEGLAAAIRRHHSPFRKQHHGIGQQDDVDTSGQREIAISRAQALAGEMDRNERGGAGGVDGDAWPLEPAE